MTPEKKMGKYSIKSLEIEFLLKSIQNTLKSFRIKVSTSIIFFSTLGSKHAFRFRLPWPLMDITTVKIPVSVSSVFMHVYIISEKKYGHFISKP